MKSIIICGWLSVLASACHYSCATCADDKYTSCLTCPSGSQFTVTQDTNVVPPQYWASLYNTGTCTQTMSPVGANALGVILFLVMGGACIFFRTKESFYLLITLQTYGMYNLIEIAWVNPIGYILQALQYFMIFNTMGSGYKERDYIMMARKNYRLDNFLKTTSIGPNIAILAAFTIISFLLLIVICIVTLRRRPREEPEGQGAQEGENIFAPVPMASQTGDKSEGKSEGKSRHIVSAHSSRQSKRGSPSRNSRRSKQSELGAGSRGQEVQRANGLQERLEAAQPEQQSQCCACWKWVSEEVLIQIAKFLLCLLFFMIQETMLVLLVTLVFVTPVSNTIIALSIIYLHILIFCMSYAYYYRVEYFKDKKVLYINYAKKIVLPIMVVVPIRVQWLFFLFAFVIIALEFIIDLYNGLYRKFRRLALYKASQIVVAILLLTYYIVERTAKSEESSKAAAIACTFFLVVFQVGMVLVEIPCAIKEKYFSGKNRNEDEGNQQLENPIEQTISDDFNKQQYGTLEIVDVQNSNRTEQNKQQQHEPTQIKQVSVSANHKMSNTQLYSSNHLAQQVPIHSQKQSDIDDKDKIEASNLDGKSQQGNSKGNVGDPIDGDDDIEVLQLGFGDGLNGPQEPIEPQEVNQGGLHDEGGSGEKQKGEGEENAQKGSEGSDDEGRNGRKVGGEEGEPETKPEQPSKKKKRRRQIIDPELRRRYGM